MKPFRFKNIAAITLALAICSSAPTASALTADAQEAILGGHKRERIQLMLRAAEEEATKSLHRLQKNSEEEFLKTQKKLDQYNKAFDIVSLILSGTQFAVQCYATGTNVANTLSDYASMIKTYMEWINEDHPFANIDPRDAMIIEYFKEGVEGISGQVANIIVCVTALAGIAGTRQFEVNLGDITDIFNRMQASLCEIEQIVTRIYLRTKCFIRIRMMSLYVRSIPNPMDKRSLIQNCFDRWHESSSYLMLISPSKTN